MLDRDSYSSPRDRLRSQLSRIHDLVQPAGIFHLALQLSMGPSQPCRVQLRIPRVSGGGGHCSAEPTIPVPGWLALTGGRAPTVAPPVTASRSPNWLMATGRCATRRTRRGPSGLGDPHDVPRPASVVRLGETQGTLRQCRTSWTGTGGRGRSRVTMSLARRADSPVLAKNSEEVAR
jgi:hypothetical protein